jgi:hypothetical protein
MDLGGGVGDAWKYWRMSDRASLVLKALPYVQEGHVGTSVTVTGVIDVTWGGTLLPEK